MQEGALRKPRQERNEDESRCLQRLDPDGSKRELAQATASVLSRKSVAASNAPARSARCSLKCLQLTLT